MCIRDRLTAASALARKYTGDNPLLIYLPETAFDQEEFLKAVETVSYTHLDVYKRQYLYS